jgi:hypothetical protein
VEQHVCYAGMDLEAPGLAQQVEKRIIGQKNQNPNRD